MSLVTDKAYLRSVYESRFTVCCVFYQLEKKYKDVLRFEGVFGGVFNKKWLKGQFKELLGVMPRMPLYRQSFQVENVGERGWLGERVDG